jgi:hypothetical protein
MFKFNARMASMFSIQDISDGMYSQKVGATAHCFTTPIYSKYNKFDLSDMDTYSCRTELKISANNV